jgi:hypothetical protein
MMPSAFLRSAARLQSSLLITAACGLAMCASTRPAFAAACGDDIEGQRVACACGDTVITDTILSPTDPVVTETCADDGLTVHAAHDADSITLHLAGLSLTGSGNGTGIRVSRGGRLGAVIVGGDDDDTRAEVAGFRTGIRAGGRNALSEVRSIDVHDNAADGLSIHAGGARIEDVRSERNGRDGISLSGHGNAVAGVTSSNNARDGLDVRGSASTIDAVTTGNRRHGAAIGGRGNQAGDLRAADNGGAGVLTTGTGHDLDGVKGTRNGAGNVADPVGAVK